MSGEHLTPLARALPRDVTFADIAVEANVSRSTVEKVARGLWQPNDDILAAVGKLLKLSPRKVLELFPDA